MRSLLFCASLAAAVLLARGSATGREYPEVLWTTYPGTGGSAVYAICSRSEGGYVLAGRKGGPSTHDGLLMGVDSLGGFLWYEQHGGDYADQLFDVMTLELDHLIACGERMPGYMSGHCLWIMRADDGGYLIWEDWFGLPDHHHTAYAVQPRAGEGYAFCGQSGYPYDDSGVGWVILTDDSGDSQNTVFLGEAPCIARSMELAADSGFVVAGYTEAAAGDWDIYLAKLDADLGLEWETTLGGEGDQRGTGVTQTEDGGYVVGGYGGIDDSDILLVRTDQDGDELWTRSYAGVGEDSCLAVIRRSEGGFAATGSYAGEAVLLGVDSLGIQEWLVTVPGTLVGRDLLQNAAGNFVVCGKDGSGPPFVAELGWSTGIASDLTAQVRNAGLLMAPNPARRSVGIQWRPGAPGPAELEVLDLSGRRVHHAHASPGAGGRAAYTWNLLDASGAPVPAGVYLVRVETQWGRAVERLVLIR